MIKLENVKLSRDLSFIFRIMTNYKESSLFLRRVDINSFEQFESWFAAELKHFYNRFYMVQNQKGENMGFVFSYDYSPLDRHAHFSIYICPEYRNLGVGPEASILFADILFTQLDLQRLYSSVYEYNEPSLLCNQNARFPLEGRLKENRYYEGKFWDLFIFAIPREFFYSEFGDVLRRLKR